MDTRDRIRRHIKQIESTFAAGDLATPERVHGERPPGAATMARLEGDISYKSETRPAGARLRLRTASAEALSAIHEYLRYRIRERRSIGTLASVHSVH